MQLDCLLDIETPKALFDKKRLIVYRLIRLRGIGCDMQVEISSIILTPLMRYFRHHYRLGYRLFVKEVLCESHIRPQLRERRSDKVLKYVESMRQSSPVSYADTRGRKGLMRKPYSQ